MRRPRLLDLFCSAGGATKGYQRAGFYVVGVDIEPQPRYCGDEFIQADALTFPLDGVDAIHASPPCQKYSALAAMHPDRNYPDLIAPTRALLEQTGLPWIMENVEGAPMVSASTLDGSHGVMLCGTMFGLGARGMELRRHRLFESSLPLVQPVCNHKLRTIGVYGHGGHTGQHRMAHAAEARDALGIDWMNRDEMTQAIPPAYTEYVGSFLLAAAVATLTERALTGQSGAGADVGRSVVP